MESTRSPYGNQPGREKKNTPSSDSHTKEQSVSNTNTSGELKKSIRRCFSPSPLSLPISLTSRCFPPSTDSGQRRARRGRALAGVMCAGIDAPVSPLSWVCGGRRSHLGLAAAAAAAAAVHPSDSCIYQLLDERPDAATWGHPINSPPPRPHLASAAALCPHRIAGPAAKTALGRHRESLDTPSSVAHVVARYPIATPLFTRARPAASAGAPVVMRAGSSSLNLRSTPHTKTFGRRRPPARVAAPDHLMCGRPSTTFVCHCPQPPVPPPP